ncbi:MAG: hypothetical protein DWQ05_00575 [Calditrichaeota bacterium]|nr:MAG: hypothetical protein DWQ05_00575 [Calditrichota bacterium]
MDVKFWEVAMRNTLLLFGIAIFFVVFAVTTDNCAQDSTKSRIDTKKNNDKNNDRINEKAADHDGDKTPNEQDADWQKNRLEKKGRGVGFTDADGDGVNDLAQDADGDGIPNGKDTDWVPPIDNPDRKNIQKKEWLDGNSPGKVQPKRAGKPKNKRGRMGFIDEDGDGINDLILDDDGDGIPNCQDEDYIQSKNANGQKMGNSTGRKGRFENGQKARRGGKK